MINEIVKNGIIGFILGDAMGVPLEFSKRRNADNKVIDMLEYGSHNLEKGSWSDDSSMVIATMKSIIDNKGTEDATDDELLLAVYNDNPLLQKIKKGEIKKNEIKEIPYIHMEKINWVKIKIIRIIKRIKLLNTNTMLY